MANELMAAKFGKLLIRSNSKLREDRGNLIVQQTEKHYRREIEDLQDRLDQLKIDRDNQLDINPSNTQTIINPSDFDHKEFVKKDMAYGKQIRETEILLEIAQRQYDDLFAVHEPENAE